jgi:hypothetical protein
MEERSRCKLAKVNMVKVGQGRETESGGKAQAGCESGMEGSHEKEMSKDVDMSECINHFISVDVLDMMAEEGMDQNQVTRLLGEMEMFDECGEDLVEEEMEVDQQGTQGCMAECDRKYAK